MLGDGTLDPARVPMPSSWIRDLGPEFRGVVEYQRKFNRPTGIDGATPIDVVFHRVVGRAAVLLNGEELGEIDAPEMAGRFSVTGKLIPHNQLVVRITWFPEDQQGLACEAGEPGLVGDVLLEIE